MRALGLAFVLACAACDSGKAPRNLDLDLIRVSPDALLHTDTIGEGKFEELATYVLVDAENAGAQGAYVTLAGELAEAGGAVIGPLKPQSLWVPAGEQRTFALVDAARKPRPTAAAARIKVRGALVPDSPPPAHAEQIREIPDDGKIVVQAIVSNAADRAGNVMVIGSFHDADGKPMTRPWTMVRVDAHSTHPVQFVGPAGSKRGTIFVGDGVF